ncbi:MAG TPA: diacylglycerol kinase family lipid kinase, partial [bacterium]|nr:diacylglycerol kinase family lipid kinase [bacterium]
GRIRYPADIEKVEHCFRRAGEDITVLETEGPLHARELAARASERGLNPVISMGGDGTLNEVINGIAGGKTALGVIPTGISNVLALELGIPSEIRAAADVIVAGETRTIDLAEINGRFFSLMASIGLDAEACRTVNPVLKRRLKRYAFHLSGLRALFSFRPGLFRIEIDGGEVLTGASAIISNARFYGGRHVVTPEARVDDGFLDICVFSRKGAAASLRYFLGVLRKRVHEYPDVSVRRATSVRIADPGLPIQIDGDFIGFTPAEIRIHPRALTVFCPGVNKSHD